MNNFFFRYRLVFILLAKVVIVATALFLAYVVRFDFKIPHDQWHAFLDLLLIAILIKLSTFWFLGLNRGWWQYTSFSDLIAIGRGNLLASLLLIAYVAMLHRMDGIPRSILILDGIFCFLLMGGLRYLRRALREHSWAQFNNSGREISKRILILGAGSAGDSIAREIRQNRDSLNIELVGLLDDDPHKIGLRIQGYPVLGGRKDLRDLCLKNKVDELIIAIPSARGNAMREILNDCRLAEVKCRTLPGISDLIDGNVSIQQIKDVDLDDLLGRDPIRLDIDEIRDYLSDKRILVTGAGGSIGSEICRQVARFKPQELVLYDTAETPMFHIHNELIAASPELLITPVLGDVRDADRVRRIFERHQPEVVFHAAAYKHVPLMEANPAEAVSTNVRGTRIVADAAHEFGAAHFVMISTDKAVNPSSVMGATKRLAEIYVQSLAVSSSTHFVTVRFGNVLGSNGSVVPIFKEQIKKGGPVTVTDPEITRFFMTIPEAVQLVLQAGSMGQGGEIFLLDMGEPVKIVSLAEELIRLSGLVPYEDIDIVFTGLRPGEKLYEELLLAGENVKPTRHESIHIAAAEVYDRDYILSRLEVLYQKQKDLDRKGIVAILSELIPEFKP